MRWTPTPNRSLSMVRLRLQSLSKDILSYSAVGAITKICCSPSDERGPVVRKSKIDGKDVCQCVLACQAPIVNQKTPSPTPDKDVPGKSAQPTPARPASSEKEDKSKAGEGKEDDDKQTPPNSSPANSSGSGNVIPAIAGAVGGVVLCGVCIVLVVVLRKRSDASSARSDISISNFYDSENGSASQKTPTIVIDSERNQYGELPGEMTPRDRSARDDDARVSKKATQQYAPYDPATEDAQSDTASTQY